MAKKIKFPIGSEVVTHTGRTGKVKDYLPGHSFPYVVSMTDKKGDECYKASSLRFLLMGRLPNQ